MSRNRITAGLDAACPVTEHESPLTDGSSGSTPRTDPRAERAGGVVQRQRSGVVTEVPGLSSGVAL
jgi:hypothetical protein